MGIFVLTYSLGYIIISYTVEPVASVKKREPFSPDGETSVFFFKTGSVLISRKNGVINIAERFTVINSKGNDEKYDDQYCADKYQFFS